MTRIRTLTSYLSATALGLLAGLVGYSCWRLEVLPGLAAVLPVPVPELIIGDVQSAAVGITTYSLALSLTLNRFGLRRSGKYILASAVFVASAGIVGARFFGLDLLPIPLLFSGGLALLLVQVNRLWLLDGHFTRTLFNSPFNNSDSATAANARLMSGLKLLNTVLPLKEAVVFHCLESEFEAVARFKTQGSNALDNRRNSVWREGIKLCQQAALTGKLVVPKDDSRTVAVPLVHEGETAGVLLIRLGSDFSGDDASLLEAIGSQFARNLKRESFSTNPTRTQSLSYFSQTGNKRKLDALNVLKAANVEQRCEASSLTHIDEGVAIAYLDGTLALVNPALLTFSGLTSEQVAKMDLFDLLNKFRTDIFDEPQIAVRRVLQTGLEYEGELNFDAKSQILNLRISLLHERQNKNGPLGIAVYVRDLTATKEYEKLKSDMISLMSHELRTPLTSINGFAELLTADETIPAQAREFVSIIANESQRMSRMINTFLSVTQLQRKDKQEVLKIPLRLDEVVRETIATLQPFAKKKRIRLIEQPAHRIPPVAADKSLITQAVKNLVNNAIKYSPERTTVTVSTALEAEAVRVCVEDRGFGIPAEAKERVWDKFYRVVREGQEKDEESTGLGLSFVREVVEQHGGHVELDSEEGRGSRFSFTLPRL
ncbi:MAG TPA: GAF domain-containing sensor histidine kinase [Pyrinomonadaceae bacterium]|nr:GAF domain-containing sensor histidine kinase [Pyrinomonadaceae bacterium]